MIIHDYKLRSVGINEVFAIGPKVRNRHGEWQGIRECTELKPTYTEVCMYAEIETNHGFKFQQYVRSHLEANV